MGAKAVKVTPDDIEQAIHESIVHGGANVMREFERSRGYLPVSPGGVEWLPAEVWPNDIVVSLDGKRVRIVAIYTMRPGCGDFSLLITGICRAGLIPTVVAPMGEMVDILTGWGWHRRIVGNTFQDRCDEWFPTKKWREQRNK